MLPVMSYSFTVRTDADGSIVVAAQNVPDGEHTVSGHDDADRVDLTVERRAPSGRYVARAAHSHSKES